MPLNLLGAESAEGGASEGGDLSRFAAEETMRGLRQAGRAGPSRLTG